MKKNAKREENEGWNEGKGKLGKRRQKPICSEQLKRAHKCKSIISMYAFET